MTLRNFSNTVVGDYFVRRRLGTNEAGESVWLISCLNCSTELPVGEQFLTKQEAPRCNCDTVIDEECEPIECEPTKPKLIPLF